MRNKNKGLRNLQNKVKKKNQTALSIIYPSKLKTYN